MALSEIVTTAIQAGTVNPARAGFGTPFFMGFHTAWVGSEVRRYTGSAAVLVDFDSHELPYLWAVAMFSQSPRPTAIKIGRLPTPTGVFHTQVLDFTDHVSGTAIAGSVVLPAGTVTPIAIAWNTNIATTLADLKTALDALTGIGTCSIASPLITVPATVAGEMVHFSISSAGGHVRDTTADWSIDDALDAALVIDPEFYGVMCDNNSPKNVDKVARWALTNDRIAFFGPQYTKPSQFATGEFSAGADYTALQANDAAVGLFTKADRRSFPEAAWVGRMFPLDPGSATYAYKRLSGVGADTYNATERGQIEAYDGNHYVAEAEIGITRPGQTFGGEWIDVVIGLAWIEARLQEGLFADLVNNDKIPYTDQGFAILVARVRAVLKIAEARSIIASGWTVTILPVAEQDSADRAARIVRGLEFQATLAGAVHTVNLSGTVTA